MLSNTTDNYELYMLSNTTDNRFVIVYVRIRFKQNVFKKLKNV
jgi:hypothetical protein